MLKTLLKLLKSHVKNQVKSLDFVQNLLKTLLNMFISPLFDQFYKRKGIITHGRKKVLK